eukprot:3439403-Prorocentrum_lima.AAC.1
MGEYQLVSSCWPHNTALPCSPPHPSLSRKFRKYLLRRAIEAGVNGPSKPLRDIVDGTKKRRQRERMRVIYAAAAMRS